MDIAVSGSSGLIGTALTQALDADGHVVRRLVRGEAAEGEVAWDPVGGTIDRGGLEGVDGVVHLAGPGIGDRRWTESRKRHLREARVAGTQLLAEASASLDRPPAVFVSASAVGYYGDRGDERLTEESGPGDDFLARLCVDWEAATGPAATAGIRVAVIRTGIVLARRGGALAKLLPLFRVGLGGRMGPGRQFWSWITLDDVVAAIRHLLDRAVSGPVNLTGPEPVTNAELTKVLGRVLRRPAVLPVPRFGPQLLIGGEAAHAFLYASQRALPAVLEADGFHFAHPDIETGLRAVLGREIS
jgi:uncharacterized protein